MMMARRVGLATVTLDIVLIRFRLAVGWLGVLCWASIICKTFSSEQSADISPADNPGAEIRWG